jgi:hypothetical protein
LASSRTIWQFRTFLEAVIAVNIAVDYDWLGKHRGLLVADLLLCGVLLIALLKTFF